MEISGLNLATFPRCSAMDLPTQQVINFNKVPVLGLPHVWFPYLEDYLYTENNYKTRNAQNSATKDNIHTENGFKIITTPDVQEHGKNPAAKGIISTKNGFITNKPPIQDSAAEDILHDQIVRLEEFDGEVIRNYSHSPELNDSFANGITMEVIDSGKQTALKESENMEGKLKESSAVASSSKSQDTSISKSPKTSRKATVCRRRREKANEREKQRIVVLKNAMNVLKNSIPAAREKTKITKLEVLKLAQEYINSLRAQLIEGPGDGGNGGCQFESPRLQS